MKTKIRITWECRVRNAEEEEEEDESVESASSPTEEDEDTISIDAGNSMDVDDAVDDLRTLFQELNIENGPFDSFISNLSVVEKGRAVRRSPRLDGMAGIYYVPSADGRCLRRSYRVRQ
jgi:hypothetical protein